VLNLIGVEAELRENGRLYRNSSTRLFGTVNPWRIVSASYVCFSYVLFSAYLGVRSQPVLSPVTRGVSANSHVKRQEGDRRGANVPEQDGLTVASHFSRLFSRFYPQKVSATIHAPGFD
jgi:hypothetical protein